MNTRERNIAIGPGQSIFLLTLGDRQATPLIVLNGGPGRSHQSVRISPVWEQLAHERPVIFYDQRGTGESTPLTTETTCTLADQIADLEAIRDFLDAEEIDLIGHSWGGYLAMAYAAHHQVHVRRLVLVSSAAPRIQDTVSLAHHLSPEISAERDRLKFAWRMGDSDAFQESERLFRSLSIFSEEKRKEYLQLAGPSIIHMDVARALHADLQRHDLRPLLSYFSQPVLVLTGRYDQVVAPSVAYEIHKAIPQSRFHVFEKSGHRPFFEEPETFYQVVNGFLEAAG